MPLSQSYRKIKFHSPLGDEVLFVTSLAGREQISRLLRFQLSMISDKTAVEAPYIVGREMLFTVNRAENTVRKCSGFFSRFSTGDEEEDRRNYREEDAPWFGLLMQTADYRIFQNLRAPDIIEQVFNDAVFTDFKLELRVQYEKWKYCIDYRKPISNWFRGRWDRRGYTFSSGTNRTSNGYS